MSTLANITSLNLSLQTGGAALAIKAVKSVAKPARTVYVFGTADDVAPNFTTVAGALTYANSLTPIVTEPVVVRLFTKADGTPYTLAGLSSWTTYANQYIYFVSDFVRLNVTDTLPTTLPEGLTVWYRDGNDVEYLYIGNVDGDAQLVGGSGIQTETANPLYVNPTLADGVSVAYRDAQGRGYLYQGNASNIGKPLVGYGQFMARLSQTGTSTPTNRVFVNTVGASGFVRLDPGVYTCSLLTSAGQPLVITANDIFFPGQNQGFAVFEGGSANTAPLGWYRLDVDNAGAGPLKIVLRFYDSTNDGPADMSTVIGSATIDVHFVYCASNTL
jgi:hypothetical protein